MELSGQFNAPAALPTMRGETIPMNSAALLLALFPIYNHNGSSHTQVIKVLKYEYKHRKYPQ
jgi:hypothetical protein